jgi:polysaccharide export outer membrane protein
MSSTYKAVLVILLAVCAAAAVPPAAGAEPYQVQPGDVLHVSVWKEDALQVEVLVRPDGGLSFPLAGEVDAAGHSVDEIRKLIEERLSKYIPGPVVTVAVKAASGNRFFVLGKVNRPGDFGLIGPIDVMQALSVAGGATAYADVNNIHVLRREGGQQIAIRFHYREVEQGRELAQNILLRSGDTVVVP